MVVLRRCRPFLALVLLLGTALGAKGQIAGLSSLDVLDMPVTARTAALGLDYLPLFDNDISIAIDNPSFIDQRFNRQLSLNYVNLFSGANFGAVSYGFHTEKFGDFVVGMRFDGYGRFEGYTEEEVPTGSFFAADYVASLGWGMCIDSNFRIGVNFKPVLSQYDVYTAFAIALDMAASYVSTNKAFAATLMGRNAGAQILTFDGTTERTPFELSAALSYKLENAPFRFFFAATELQRWNLRYNDPLNPTEVFDPYTGEIIAEKPLTGILDNAARHTVFGVELSIQNAFFARVGYSYRQTAEMHGISNINFSGFSYGIGIRKPKFDFAFSRNNYHLGQAPNYLSLSFKI